MVSTSFSTQRRAVIYLVACVLAVTAVALSGCRVKGGLPRVKFNKNQEENSSESQKRTSPSQTLSKDHEEEEDRPLPPWYGLDQNTKFWIEIEIIIYNQETEARTDWTRSRRAWILNFINVIAFDFQLGYRPSRPEFRVMSTQHRPSRTMRIGTSLIRI